MLTRKHFKALADILRKHKPYIDDGEKAMDVWVSIVGDISNVCKSENPDFSRMKFYEACGVD